MLVTVALAMAGLPKSGNMNGKYKVASGGKFAVPWNDDYLSKGYEYFDVWAPEMATHYGEVFWTDQGQNPLPKAIVDRFKGKTMAIMGYEQDQVMVIPTGQPGVNPEKDVSVPINWAYNHHYMAWMTGSASEMQHVFADPDDATTMGQPADVFGSTKWMAVDKPGVARPEGGIPTSQMFSEGNGGESRKSFHGYPAGYAQLIHSPEQWHITPMQIDTRNRDCGATPESVSNCTQFIPGPEPLQARYGRKAPKGTNYSGVLECPCNSRFGGDESFYPTQRTKVIDDSVQTRTVGVCGGNQRFNSADACFAAATTLGFPATSFVNATTSNASLVDGCSVVVEGEVATVYYNTGGKGAAATGTKRAGAVSSSVGTKLSVTLDSTGGTNFVDSKKGVYCNQNRASGNILKSFNVKNTSTAADVQAALAACKSFCSADDACEACSIDCTSTSGPVGCATGRFSALKVCGKLNGWKGLTKGDVSQKSGVATITLSGPAGGWFAVGFNAKLMSDAPYTIVVNSTGVSERKIGTCGSEAEHCAGTPLADSVKVVSSSVSGGVRTVTLTRGLVGASADHFSFSLTNPTFNFITAAGPSQAFGYHGAQSRVASIITLTAPGAATAVCSGSETGDLCSTDAGKTAQPGAKGCNNFVKNCVAPPAGSLLEQQNPTCNSKQYSGGLSCCHHGRIMLDADQEIRPELLRYHMKWRFWFQEYTPATATANASHYDLPRIYYQTEAHAGEYDIPPAFRMEGEKEIAGYGAWPMGKPTPGTTCTGSCPDGADCECVHTIVFKWSVSNMRLIYAGGHCHAPACISIELYRNDTGHEDELLCRQLPYYGLGNVAEDKYDESGYLALPPCLWGDEPGLEPSVLLPRNTPMYSIKKNRNTHTGHYGEMASWQMRGVYF